MESSTRRASARVVVLLCAALGAGALADGAMPSPTLAMAGGEPGPNRADVTAAVAFREELGLRADRAFVASTFGNRGFSSRAWGIPLDPSESADLGKRAKLQADAAEALRTWARDPASAGAYLDQGAKGRPVFLTTADPARARGKLANILPSTASARFLRVRHSTAQLLALQDRVNADWRAGALAALGVESTAIDARANAVVIGVPVADAAIGAALRDRYGDAVQARAELAGQGGDAGCTSRTACPPAKGGIEIVSGYNGNTCTIGFMVRVEGSPDPRILTAGHCIAKSGGTGTSRTWSHNGTSFGWAELGYWTDGADADVGIIDPSSNAISGARNLLYRSSSSDVASVTGLRATAEQVQGSLVCRSAAVSGYHCGTIELTNRSKDVDGHTIDHQWVVDFDGCPGDSGGPYFLGQTAYGIHTDSTLGCNPGTNQAWYSPIGWVLDVLATRGHPVTLCTTSTCGADTGVWTPRGSLDQATWNAHLVTLKDGRVLQVGGESGSLFNASTASSSSRMPELFDRSTGAWSDAASPPWLPAGCDGQFAVKLADGRVLVGGGRHTGSGAADACDGAQIYDPGDGTNGSWTVVAAPPTVLAGAGAALLEDGRAFVTGGSGSSGSTSVAMAYSPADDAWTTLASGPAGAIDPLVLALHDGRVLVSGGYVVADAAAPGYVDVTATAIYDPGSDTWAATAAVGARGVGGVVLGDGRVVVAGGQHLSWNGSQSSSFATAVSRFDPSAGTWASLAPLPAGRAGFGLAELPDGFLVAAGGWITGTAISGSPTRSVVAWDPATKAWYAAPGMQSSRGDPGAAILANGSLLVAAGGTSATETYVTGDILPPTAAAPSSILRAPASMTTSKVPVHLSWSASDAGGSGVGTYDVARSTDGGAFTTIATHLLSTSYDTSTSRTHTYRYEVRARDWAGNVGPWNPAATFKVNVSQQTSPAVTYGGTWRSSSSSSYSGGSVRYTTAAGAWASYTFTGRSVGFVTSRGPTRGSVRVYIDGTAVATVGLYASTLSFGYVAFQKTWSTAGKHTIKIVSLGNTGHPRVDVDAFEVLGNP